MIPVSQQVYEQMKLEKILKNMQISTRTRARTGPSVWTRGLAFLGLAGTLGPIEDLPRVL